MARSKSTGRKGKQVSKTPEPRKKSVISAASPKSAPPARKGKQRPTEEDDHQMLFGKKLAQTKTDTPKHKGKKDAPGAVVQKTPKGATPKSASKGKTPEMKKTPTPKTPPKGGSEDSDDDDDDDEESFDLDDLDSDELAELGFNDDDDDDDDEDSDDEDSDDEDSDEGTAAAISAKLQQMRKGAGKAGADEDEDTDEDDSEEGSESDSPESSPVKKVSQPTVKAKGQSQKVQQEKVSTQKAQAKGLKALPQKTGAKQEKAKAQPEKAKSQEAGAKATQEQQKQETPQGAPVTLSAADVQARGDVDRRTLFIKNLPGNVTEEHIQKLSKEIKVIRLRLSHRKNAEPKPFAYLEFQDEKICDKNFQQLKGKKIEGNEIFVDYVGAKSKFQMQRKPAALDETQIDPCKLYITGFGLNTTEKDLKKIFPKSVRIELPRRKRDNMHMGFAFAFFRSMADAKEAHDNGQGKKIGGLRLVVLYGKKAKQVAAVKRKQNPPSKGPAPAKKAKGQQQQQETDSDDESDDLEGDMEDDTDERADEDMDDSDEEDDDSVDD